MTVSCAVLCARHKEALVVGKFGRHFFSGPEVSPTVRLFSVEMMPTSIPREDYRALYDRVRELVEAFGARHESCELMITHEQNGGSWMWGDVSAFAKSVPTEGGREFPSGWIEFHVHEDAQWVRLRFAGKPDLVDQELARGKVDLAVVLRKGQPRRQPSGSSDAATSTSA